MRRVTAAVGVPAALSVVVAIAALLGSLGPASLDRTVVVALINVVFVVALYVFVGNSGVWSFGHLSFAAGRCLLGGHPGHAGHAQGPAAPGCARLRRARSPCPLSPR